jgi:hypothetical protein
MSDLPLRQCLQVKGTDIQDLLECPREREGQNILAYHSHFQKGNCDRVNVHEQQKQHIKPAFRRKVVCPQGVSSWRCSERTADGDRMSIQQIVRESSHGDTASIQWIASLVVTNKAACAYSSQQVFNDTAKVELHSAVCVRYWVRAVSGL